MTLSKEEFESQKRVKNTEEEQKFLEERLQQNFEQIQKWKEEL